MDHHVHQADRPDDGLAVRRRVLSRSVVPLAPSLPRHLGRGLVPAVCILSCSWLADLCSCTGFTVKASAQQRTQQMFRREGSWCDAGLVLVLLLLLDLVESDAVCSFSCSCRDWSDDCSCWSFLSLFLCCVLSRILISCSFLRNTFQGPRSEELFFGKICVVAQGHNDDDDVDHDHDHDNSPYRLGSCGAAVRQLRGAGLHISSADGIQHEQQQNSGGTQTCHWSEPKSPHLRI